MKVSVIIPTYNRANLVSLTLDSLIDQDYPKDKYEIIVVDNNSMDNTSETIKSYFEEHTNNVNMVYLRELRQGDGYARNSGAVVARGEYIFFADDDSLFDRNWVSCMAAILDMYPMVGMIGSRITVKWDEEPPKWVKRYEYLLGKSIKAESGYIISSNGFVIANGSLGIRRDLYIKVGGNNPGQIGEWLVGDGEVGLFNKVRNLGYPIAFTDDTTMWHMQTRAKNGTYNDIIRRLKNIAISDAYGDVVVKGMKQYRDLKKRKLAIVRSLFKLKRSRIREAVFRYLSDKAYNVYVDKYQSVEFLNANLNLEDHNLGTNYVAPQPTMTIEYKK